MIIATVRIAMRVCTQVSTIAVKNSLIGQPDHERGQDGGDEDRGAGRERLEVPDCAVGLVIERDEHLVVEARPRDLEIADQEHLRDGPDDHDHRHDDPRIPALDAADMLGASLRLAALRSMASAKRSSGAGFQTLRNRIVRISETSDESTSVRL